MEVLGIIGLIALYSILDRPVERRKKIANIRESVED